MSLRARLRTLFRMFLLFTVLAGVALISAITTIRVTIPGHQETTPNFVGVPLERGQQHAAALGLTLKVVDKLFSSQYLANEIVSQQPPVGTRVKVGQQVHVMVSLGPPQVTVPDLVGTSIRAAQITAIQRGLTVGNVTAVHWPGTETDQVVAQDPPPETADVHSPAVNFLVSLGAPPPTLLCPRFVGRSLSGARRALEEAGFKVGVIQPVPVPELASGTILTQSPRAGSMIGPDTVFSFQVVE